METSPFACNVILCVLLKSECFPRVSKFSKRISDSILKVYSLDCNFLGFFCFKVIVVQITKHLNIIKIMNDNVSINMNFQKFRIKYVLS